MCVVFCFIFHLPFLGGGGTLAVVRPFRRSPERERDADTSSKTHCSLFSVLLPFLLSHFFLLCLLLPHTHTMVKLQSRRPQEATFPLPEEKKKCEGSAHMDLFIPVTVVTEAQTLCDDQGNKIDPRFGPTWPMERLV